MGNLGPGMIQMIWNNGQILVVAGENSVGYIQMFWLLPRSAYPQLRTSVSHTLSVSRSTRNSAWPGRLTRPGQRTNSHHRRLCLVYKLWEVAWNGRQYWLEDRPGIDQWSVSNCTTHHFFYLSFIYLSFAPLLLVGIIVIVIVVFYILFQLLKCSYLTLWVLLPPALGGKWGE